MKKLIINLIIACIFFLLGYLFFLVTSEKDNFNCENLKQEWYNEGKSQGGSRTAAVAFGRCDARFINQEPKAKSQKNLEESRYAVERLAPGFAF